MFWQRGQYTVVDHDISCWSSHARCCAQVVGTLTHQETNVASRGIHLTVTGKVTIAAGGKIDVSGKSTFRQNCRNGNCYAGSYGGVGYTSTSYTAAPYGSVPNPVHLGMWAYNEPWRNSAARAGGLVIVTCAQLDLQGSIVANGHSLSSGGTINVKLTKASEITAVAHSMCR